MTNKETRYHIAYLRMAQVWSGLSHCRRAKVGALIVKDGMIISDGYNGTPSGFPNDCEDCDEKTHWYVLHAEANAMMKVARSSQSTGGATLYVTTSPCRDCSKLIIQSGIARVVYCTEYRDTTGLSVLRESGVEVVKIELE